MEECRNVYPDLSVFTPGLLPCVVYPNGGTSSKRSIGDLGNLKTFFRRFVIFSKSPPRPFKACCSSNGRYSCGRIRDFNTLSFQQLGEVKLTHVIGFSDVPQSSNESVVQLRRNTQSLSDHFIDDIDSASCTVRV